MKPRIVIAAPVRTAIGKTSRDGFLRTVQAHELLAECFRHVIERSGINPSLIEEVIAGQFLQLHNAQDIAKVAALIAGIPDSVPGYSVQRNCASGLQAITSAMTTIEAGRGEIFLVGGTESMSNFPYALSGARWGLEMKDWVAEDMVWRGLSDPFTGEHVGQTVECVAKKYGITRTMQDVFAVASHRKALKAQREGKFKSQIIPIKVRERIGLGQTRERTITQDQCIIPNANAEVMASLPNNIFVKEGGTVTAGNASQVSDGAAAMLVLTEEQAQRLNITPMAEIIDFVYVSVEPRFFGEAPIPAIRKLLSRTGLTVEDIDCFEINEAFAAQCLPCQLELKIPDEKFNIMGGAIALGHPIGATGSILTVKAAHILKEYDMEYAVVAMCIGGGMAGAMLIRNYRNSENNRKHQNQKGGR